MQTLTREPFIEKTPQEPQLSESELKGLVLGLTRFQSTLSPAQQSAFAKTLDPNIVVPPVEEVAGLFGDMLTQEELQEFLTAKVDLDPHAPTNMSTIAACIASIIFDC